MLIFLDVMKQSDFLIIVQRDKKDSRPSFLKIPGALHDPSPEFTK